MDKVLLVLVVVLGGCGDPGEPHGMWTERPDAESVDLARGDLATKRDQFTGLWCVQAIGDGGRDALAPGVECDPDSADRCALPVVCSVKSSEHASRCESGPGDGAITTRCCQYVSSPAPQEGWFFKWENCGSGWACVDQCIYFTIPADGDCPAQTILSCLHAPPRCLTGCGGGPGCDKS